MVLDSSALVAILLKEPGYEQLSEKLQQSEKVVMSAASVLESVMVVSGRSGHDARTLVYRTLREIDAAIVPFDSNHLESAIDAFSIYGKGKHSAGLNFGDCFTYATAKLEGEPVLFLGDDFSQTDLTVA